MIYTLQLTQGVQGVQEECQALKEELANERANCKHYEELLTKTREKEFHSELSASEKDAELQILKDKVGRQQKKL